MTKKNVEQPNRLSKLYAVSLSEQEHRLIRIRAAEQGVTIPTVVSAAVRKGLDLDSE